MAAPKDGGVEREKGDLWAIYIGGWTEIEDKILSFLAVPSSYLTNRFRWNYYDHQIAACKTAAQANTLCLVSKYFSHHLLRYPQRPTTCAMFYSDIALTKAHASSRTRRSGSLGQERLEGGHRRDIAKVSCPFLTGDSSSGDDSSPTSSNWSNTQVSIERLLRSRFCSSNNRDDSFDRASAHRQAFRALLQRCDTRGPAKRINLYGCEFLSDSELSQIICLCCDVLTHLDLFECSSLSSEFIGVLRAATRLEHVNLRGLDQLTCRALCAWLGSSSICHLRYINLSGVSDCRDEVLTTIAENRVSECIQEVYVARTLVTDAGLVVLIENCHNLKALDVAANLGVSDTLLDAVVTHGTSLQWIDLRGTSIHDDAVANLLALMPSLGVSWMSSQGNVALVMTDGVA